MTKRTIRAVLSAALLGMSVAASVFSTASLAADAATAAPDTGNRAATLSAASVILKETNASLRTTGKLSIKDVDSPETFEEQSNVAGKTGTFSIDRAGRWTYVANSAFDDLNVGQSVSDKFTVASADGTTTLVSITINGTNDAAILSKAAVELDETNEPLTTSGTLSISDVDSPETFEEQSNIAGTNGTFSINSDGAWSYMANSAFDELKAGKSVKDSFTVVSADGTTTKVKIAINGSNDAAILSSASVVLDETNVPLTTTGKLSISDVDSARTFVAKKKVMGVNGTFSIDAAGTWIYVANSALDNLNVGQSASDTFTVASADDTTTNVQVTINGTNDPAILSSAHVMLSESNEVLRALGTLIISDMDSPETFVAQSNVAGTNGIFNIDTAGRWTYV
ncbi:MAG: VCBS domain-containing protein, partial [Gallionella sp.]